MRLFIVQVDGPGFESFRIHFPNFHRHRLAANRNSAASSVSNLALLLAVGQAAVTLSTDVNGSQLDQVTGYVRPDALRNPGTVLSVPQRDET